MRRGTKKVEIDAVVGYPALGRVEGRYEIEATMVTDVFAVNHDLALDNEGDVDYRKTWNVTHVPTGYAVFYGLPTAQVARAGAKLLHRLGYGEIATEDPTLANQEFLDLGSAELISWVQDLVASSKTGKTLARKVERGTPSGRPRRRKGRQAEASPPPTRATRGRAPRQKKGTPATPPDLLSLAEKARKSQNPGYPARTGGPLGW